MTLWKAVGVGLGSQQSGGMAHVRKKFHCHKPILRISFCCAVIINSYGKVELNVMPRYGAELSLSAWGNPFGSSCSTIRRLRLSSALWYLCGPPKYVTLIVLVSNYTAARWLPLSPGSPVKTVLVKAASRSQFTIVTSAVNLGMGGGGSAAN